jgi:hypothetical protein
MAHLPGQFRRRYHGGSLKIPVAGWCPAVHDGSHVRCGGLLTLPFAVPSLRMTDLA